MRKLNVSILNRSICLLLIAYSLLATSCSITKQISKQAKATILKDSAVNTGHIGISIYDPAANKYLYNHNATQYFIPASNVKLFTLYAGMKYLGDSLVGARVFETTDTLYFQPTGDPTFLHSDFRNQPFLNYLSNNKKSTFFFPVKQDFKKYGLGWAWDDEGESYMAERSTFPLYGNVFTFYLKDSLLKSNPPARVSMKYFEEPMMSLSTKRGKYKITRTESHPIFHFTKSDKKFSYQQIPFPTDRLYHDQLLLLSDTLKISKDKFEISFYTNPIWQKVYTQPSDSLFKPMMHQSDNFFAEQTLLMASNEFLGFMSDEKIIDTVLKSSLISIAQRPKWVDGSGLSRYNLFTPQSFVQLLNQLRLEFGLQRLKAILPTGGKGTLSSYYKKYENKIFAKTGTLSNNCALSGYLITNKGRLLIFSVLNNNYITGATPIRKAVEKFLAEIIEKH
jgi:serine-type D-Ala-D-Ala carboxypeptidase/endopeptidase (penicillin-binding protein 4)